MLIMIVMMMVRVRVRVDGDDSGDACTESVVFYLLESP